MLAVGFLVTTIAGAVPASAAAQAPRAAADTCWTKDITRPYPNWKLNPTGAVRLQVCYHRSGTGYAYARARLIGLAHTHMWGKVGIEFRGCPSNGYANGHNEMVFPGNPDNHTGFDYGTQAYGGTYFRVLQSGSIYFPLGTLVKVRMFTGGAVFGNPHQWPIWALTPKGPTVGGWGPGEYYDYPCVRI
ncbi:hypothetical protein [Actinomadura opuntiae]|uniref:hypothetical protein n=1 Tax=Actinomadura sp. OS1-43 TaxID=604315 RepID=UPI00255A7D91|nr:hypothetical protein [Actinomadura sp. OS1-43]